MIQDNCFPHEIDREGTQEMLSREQGAEKSGYKNLVQSYLGGLVDMQKTISPCHPKINQWAKRAPDQASEIIVISSESSDEDGPPKPGAQHQVVDHMRWVRMASFGAMESQASEFRALVSWMHFTLSALHSQWFSSSWEPVLCIYLMWHFGKCGGQALIHWICVFMRRH